MRTNAGIVVVTALAALALAASAAAAPASNWYWTPGACKSMLQTHGVAINDGRTFNVAKAYCVGLHNHCWLSQGIRRYKVFDTVMRSGDGVVRYMQLTVTGKNSWSGGQMKILETNMPLAAFDNAYGTAAWSVAAKENQGGCFDVHP